MAVTKKIWSVVSTILVVLMVLCAVFLMGSRLLGFQFYTVISGSMEPKYMVGDLLYVDKVDPSEIKVGDDITFVLNEDLVLATHQVIRIDAANSRFYTKGIANEIEDSEPVHFNNVVGVPMFSIPKLGYVSDFIQNPPGIYITVVGGIILIMLVFLPDIISKKKRDEDDAESDTDSDKMKNAIDTANEENERLKNELEKLRSEMAGKNNE